MENSSTESEGFKAVLMAMATMRAARAMSKSISRGVTTIFALIFRSGVSKQISGKCAGVHHSRNANSNDWDAERFPAELGTGVIDSGAGGDATGTELYGTSQAA